MSGRNDPPPPPSRTVQIEHLGKTHIGSYKIEQGMITVRYGGRQKTAHLGGSAANADSLARTTLGELVTELQSKK